jgi:hypothetical protein
VALCGALAAGGCPALNTLGLADNRTATTTNRNRGSVGNGADDVQQCAMVGARLGAVLESTAMALTSLDLSGCELGADGVAPIFAALRRSGLRVLRLDGNRCGDAPLAALGAALAAPGSALESLGLAENGIGSVAPLCDALAGGNATLAHLDLGCNPRLLCGPGLVCLAAALATNRALTSLHCGAPAVVPPGNAAALGAALALNSRLRSLSLRFAGLGNLDGLLHPPRLGGCASVAHSALTELDLGCCEFGDDGAAALAEALRLRRWPLLQRAALGSNGIGPAGAAAICGSISIALTALDLSGNPLGPAGLRAVALLALGATAGARLAELRLSSTGADADAAAALAGALAGNTSLTRLDLARNPIGDAGATAIAGALRRNTALIWLRLGCRRATAAAAHAFADTLGGTNSDDAVGFRVNTTLRSLVFAARGAAAPLDPPHAESISAALHGVAVRVPLTPAQRLAFLAGTALRLTTVAPPQHPSSDTPNHQCGSTATPNHQCGSTATPNHQCGSTATPSHQCGSTATRNHQCSGTATPNHQCSGTATPNHQCSGTATPSHQCSGTATPNHQCGSTATPNHQCGSTATPNHQCTPSGGGVARLPSEVVRRILTRYAVPQGRRVFRQIGGTGWAFETRVVLDRIRNCGSGDCESGD